MITVDHGATLIGSGALGGAISDGGRIAAQGGTLSVLGAVSGRGTVAIDTGATLLAGASLKASHIGFLAGTGETLVLDRLTAITGTIAGFGTAGVADVIDLAKFTVTGSAFSRFRPRRSRSPVPAASPRCVSRAVTVSAISRSPATTTTAPALPSSEPERRSPASAVGKGWRYPPRVLPFRTSTIL